MLELDTHGASMLDKSLCFDPPSALVYEIEIDASRGFGSTRNLICPGTQSGGWKVFKGGDGRVAGGVISSG